LAVAVVQAVHKVMLLRQVLAVVVALEQVQVFLLQVAVLTQ
jgi:hypothetical protein